jgi:hypoxanthine phosphoribosyltransferase
MAKTDESDENSKPCDLISWSRFQQLTRGLAEKIRNSGFRPDLIIAIGRGGYMPARLLSDYFGIMDLADIKIEHYRGTHKQASAVIKYPLTANVSDRKVLLVDDVSDSGDTFSVAIKHILQCGTPVQLRSAVLHHKTTSIFTPDYYARRIVKWRWLIYPWAVTEDIASFIKVEVDLPESLEHIKQNLLERHNISVSMQQIKDALLLLSNGVKCD